MRIFWAFSHKFCKYPFGLADDAIQCRDLEMSYFRKQYGDETINCDGKPKKREEIMCHVNR